MQRLFSALRPPPQEDTQKEDTKTGANDPSHNVSTSACGLVI